MERITSTIVYCNLVKHKISTLFNTVILLSTLFLMTVSIASATTHDALWQITDEPSWGSQAEIIRSQNIDSGRFYNVVEKHRRHEYSAAKSVSYYRYVYTIKNDSGLDASAPISVEFDPIYEQVQLHQVLVHRDGEKINQLHRDNIQLLQRETELEDGLYNGNQTLHLLLSDQRVGDTIEYSFSIIGHNPVFDGHVFGWSRLQASVSVGNYYFRLQFPEDIKVTTRTYAGDLSPEKNVANGYQQLTWQEQNTEPSEYQSDVPSSYMAQTYIQYSDFPDWSTVAAWAKPLYELDEKTSKEVVQQAERIKSKWNTTDQQIDAAIVFVQDKIRYTGINTGIGGFKPDTPEQILNRRYGDCKDKALLLVALLREFGVTAHPALVHTDEGDALPDYLPSPDAFNHMIAKIPDHNGKSYWVDGTMTLQGSTLDSLYQGGFQQALVPAQASLGLQAYSTPDSTLPNKEILEQYNLFHNNETENSTLTITSSYRSSAAESMRRSVRSKGKRKLQSSYLNYYENRFETIKIGQPLEIHDDRAANTLTTIEHYIIDDAWEVSEDYSDEESTWYVLYLQADNITSQLSVPSDRRRHQPLLQNHPVNVTHQIELTTADGWEIEDEDTEISNDYFKYNSSSTVKGTTLTLNYSLATFDDVITVADSRRYIKELKKTLDDPYYHVWFEFPVLNENLQNLSNQLTGISAWFKQTAEVLSSSEP